MTDAFDDQALLDRVDGDFEFLEETIAMLDEDSPALLEAIRAAVSSGDAAALVKPAHALKGMLSNFCAEPAETTARELEGMAREQRLAHTDTAVERMEHEVGRLKQALHQFLRDKAQ